MLSDVTFDSEVFCDELVSDKLVTECVCELVGSLEYFDEDVCKTGDDDDDDEYITLGDDDDDDEEITGGGEEEEGNGADELVTF
jgi:hypothetical protein